MRKPRIFAIVTGSSVVQKPNRQSHPVNVNTFDHIPGLGRIVNEVTSFEPLLNSTEMIHKDRAKIAYVIY